MSYTPPPPPPPQQQQQQHRPTVFRPSTTWTPSDDQLLKEARGRGLHWQTIADQHFQPKTANACRKRHERLMDREQAEEWDGVKLEQLAQTYNDVRREMWTILADRLGEKWTVVETKCMEKGLKNLSAAARAARRRSGVDEDDSVSSAGDGAEWASDPSQPGTGRMTQQEFHPPPEYQYRQLPLPNVHPQHAQGPPPIMHPQHAQATGPPMTSSFALSSAPVPHYTQTAMPAGNTNYHASPAPGPQANYGHWYPAARS